MATRRCPPGSTSRNRFGPSGSRFTPAAGAGQSPAGEPGARSGEPGASATGGRAAGWVTFAGAFGGAFSGGCSQARAVRARQPASRPSRVSVRRGVFMSLKISGAGSRGEPETPPDGDGGRPGGRSHFWDLPENVVDGVGGIGTTGSQKACAAG